MNQRRKKVIFDGHMPHKVSKRIIERCAREGRAVVVAREGQPSRVYALEMYLKMQEHPTKVQPWKHRKDRKDRQANPLGAVDMRAIFAPLTREHFYE